MSEITELNHRALTQAIGKLRESAQLPLRDVLLLSPSLEDVAFVRRQFPESRLFVATRETWDLNQPFPARGGVDVVIASNVFHYSPSPERWFTNVLQMTRYLVLQDLIFRRRSTTADGLCDDGDSVRYALRSRGIESAFADAYDLSGLDSQIEVFDEYAGGRNEHHARPLAAPRHYCAVIRSPQQADARPRLSGRERLRYRWPALGFALRLAVGR